MLTSAYLFLDNHITASIQDCICQQKDVLQTANVDNEQQQVPRHSVERDPEFIKDTPSSGETCNW